ncbi:MAG: IS110 family transposase [Ideonella sp. MAG2]|nr:MAG: IS110 family transposase [Ideonella sp. MAG2]TDM09829.1 MAG: IS110 family transposase [Ideonella sp. MAG2]
MPAARVGVDLAKRVIQVHAVDAAEKVLLSRSLPREKFLAWCAQLPPGCLVVMEVSSSAHHWARALLAMGLQPRIISAHLAAPYRTQGRRGKNDANDSAAICEAASRPHMHFVPVKSVEQQSLLAVHRLREGVKTDRTACINRIRGILLEFGVAVPTGSRALQGSLDDILEDASNELNALTRWTLQRAQAQWRELDAHLQWCDERLAAHARDNAQVQRAGQLMGVGPVTASAAVATVGDFKQFRSAQQFGGWLGLAPSQNSSGGKARLGGITKRGDIYLRTLLIQGAKSVVNTAHLRDDPISRWAAQLRDRVGWQKAVVALANKNARILWAVMSRGIDFDPHHRSVKPGDEFPSPQACAMT